jgi:purine nucleoside permease
MPSLKEAMATVPFAAALVAAILLFPCAAASSPSQQLRLSPRALVIVAFADNGSKTPTEEAAPWVLEEGIDERIATASKTSLRCNASRTVCLLITGVGKVNAATSLLSLGMDPAVDLRRTYLIVSGIAGVSPSAATIGSPAWAGWIVDYDLAHEIDARELPPDFADSRFQQGCTTETGCGKAGWREGTEAFELDSRAVRFAYGLTKNLRLPDPPLLAKIRSAYSQRAARERPHVERCDIEAGDTYWVGTRLAQFADGWMKHWTNGAGTYCMTAMEDTAYAGSIKTLASLGKVDAHRFLDLRTGSDFDRQHPGQSAIGLLDAGIAGGTFQIAAQNGYLTSRVVVRYIDAHWDALRNGLP